MVFKSFTLARQSLSKGFTHGYAQSLVAGVSQNSPLASFQQHDRFRKVGAKHNQHAFASTSTTNAVKQAVAYQDHQDAGLAAYYAAWQKYRIDDKDWSQFQFRKLIEWTPQIGRAHV